MVDDFDFDSEKFKHKFKALEANFEKKIKLNFEDFMLSFEEFELNFKEIKLDFEELQI